MTYWSLKVDENGDLRIGDEILAYMLKTKPGDMVYLGEHTRKLAMSIDEATAGEFHDH